MKTKLKKMVAWTLVAALGAFGTRTAFAENTVTNLTQMAAYATMTEAITDANPGSVLQLLADIDTGDAPLQISKNLVIDLNGKTWTTSARTQNVAAFVVQNCEVMLTNGTMKVEGTAQSALYCTSRTGANLTVADVVVDSSAKQDYSVMTIRAGTVTLVRTTLNKKLTDGCADTIVDWALFTVDPGNATPISKYGKHKLGEERWLVLPLGANKAVIVSDSQCSLFTSLGDALGAAQAGETVNLLTNVTETTTLTIGKNLTVDLGGHAVVADAACARVFDVVNATVTIENGAITNATADALGLLSGGTLALTNLAVQAKKKGVCVNGGDALTVGAGASVESLTEESVYSEGDPALAQFIAAGLFKGTNDLNHAVNGVRLLADGCLAFSAGDGWQEVGVAGVIAVTGRTATSLTVAAEVGFDYAVVTNLLADPAWVAVTEESLAENRAAVFPEKPAGAFTFTNLVKGTDCIVLKRRSGDALAPTETCTHSTSVHDEGDLARDFGFATFPNGAVDVAAAADGNGYVVTLRQDVPQGAKLPDDVGKLVIDLDRFYLAATDGQHGLEFVPCGLEGREYDPELFADVAVVGPGRIVGGKPTSGSAVGGMGVCATNENCRGVILTLEDRAKVYGGGYLKNNAGVEFGNGADGMAEDGGDGVDGQPGVGGVGITNLIVRTASVFGGAGGNGGSSVDGAGGNGGAGADALGAGVGVTVLENATFVGGAGGAGGSSDNGAGGNGGNGGAGLSRALADLATDGCSFTGGEGGAAGEGSPDGTAGTHGSRGKPAAPASDVQLQGVTGETIRFVADPYMIFDLYAGDMFVATYTNDTGTVQTNDFGRLGGTLLVPNMAYVITSRYMANDARDEAESFERVTHVTTTLWTAADIEAMLYGQAEVTLDGDGLYLVTLTNDLAQSVFLPENVGKLTLDLNGHEIVGSADTAAIVITARPEDYPLNPQNVYLSLSLLLTGEGRLVGGAGSAGADGAPAIANKSQFLDLEDAVTLDGPTLVGGAGGRGLDAATGNGGTGGRGGDAVGAGLTVVYVSGGAVGGTGGAGGDTSDTSVTAQGGNGGVGGTANVYDESGAFIDESVGGNGGDGGVGPVPGNLDADGSLIRNGGAGAKWGNPGGVYGPEGLREVLVRIGDASDTADVRYYLSLEDAIDAACDNDVLAVIRDCALEDEVEMLSEGVTLTTEDGAKISLNADIVINSAGVKIGAVCDFADGEGVIDIRGQVETFGGSNVCAKVEAGGVLTALAGTLGSVEVAGGGKFQVNYESDVRVMGSISAEDPMNVFLFGGTYDQSPTNPVNFVRAPVKTEGKNPWRIELDTQYKGMVRIGGEETKAFTSLVKAFGEISKLNKSAEIFMLQDETVDQVLLDQNPVDVTIYGNDKTLTDMRGDEACESALFNLSGNVRLVKLNVEGNGRAGSFIRPFKAKDVSLEGCTVTGYDCRGVDGAIPLICMSSSGTGTRLFVTDTTITGNVCSCAIAMTDSSAGNFIYTLHVGGETTITDSGAGVISDREGQIVMSGDLTGGFVDVSYEGYGGFPGKFAKADAAYAGADNFRYVDQKTCGRFVKEDDQWYVTWANDVRQWVAEVDNGGEAAFYESVEEAFAAVQDGGKVILHQDCGVAGAVNVERDFTLDLNGKALTNSANRLRFKSGSVVVSNGTLTADCKYALYVNAAAVQLADGLTVIGDAYVAKGQFAAVSASVDVTGAFVKTTYGTVTLGAGRYVSDPTPYLADGFATCAIDEDGYLYRVVAGAVTPGFEGGFVPEIFFSAVEGEKTVVDMSAGAGKVTTDSTITLPGIIAESVEVRGLPAGWIATVADDGAGNAVITFAMDRAKLRAVIASEDPAERPLVIDCDEGTVRINVKNGVAGFWYYIKKVSLGDHSATILGDSVGQLVSDGPFALTGTFTPEESGFFRVGVSDRNPLAE